MISSILLETPIDYEAGTVTLHLDRKIEVKLTPEEAQRLVNNYVHLELSTQLHAEAPTLVVGDQVFWRVPIHLTFPSFGDVGQVGFIQVDPVTGEMDTSSSTLNKLTHNAENLANRFTSPAAN
jgi:hypothetical protein